MTQYKMHNIYSKSNRLNG